MSNSITITPAYGRDYKSKEEILKDFNSGKDFVIASFVHPYCGKYANKEDFKKEGLKQVTVRYSKLRKSCVIDID